jgi:hypothetical protein
VGGNGVVYNIDYANMVQYRCGTRRVCRMSYVVCVVCVEPLLIAARADRTTPTAFAKSGAVDWAMCQPNPDNF